MDSGISSGIIIDESKHCFGVSSSGLVSGDSTAALQRSGRNKSFVDKDCIKCISSSCSTLYSSSKSGGDRKYCSTAIYGVTANTASALPCTHSSASSSRLPNKAPLPTGNIPNSNTNTVSSCTNSHRIEMQDFECAFLDITEIHVRHAINYLAIKHVI